MRLGQAGYCNIFYCFFLSITRRYWENLQYIYQNIKEYRILRAKIIWVGLTVCRNGIPRNLLCGIALYTFYCRKTGINR